MQQISNQTTDHTIRESNQKFTGKEICWAARVTPRQLQWWCENDKSLSYVGSGHPREFTLGDALLFRVYAELTLKLGLNGNGAGIRWDRGELRRVLSDQRDRRYLVTNGKRYVWRTTPEQVIETYLQPGVFGTAVQGAHRLHVVDVVELLSEIVARVRSRARTFGAGGAA